MFATFNRAIADRVFFGAMGLGMATTVFLGFAPTFFLREAAAPPLTPLLHWHGIATSAWMLLFMVQSGLIAAHRIRIHRRVGYAGAGLAAAVAILTLIASIVSRGFTNRLVFSAGGVVMFVIFVVAGIACRRDPGAHKRLMLLATLSLISPAISRLHLPFVSHDSFGPNFAALFFLIPALVYDLATQRRIHPAMVWGGAFMIAMLPLRMYLKDHVFS
jgi:hypothetical protein